MQISREQQISDRTAYDQGDEFTSDAQVREYFTVAEQIRMFGENASCTDQDELDAMAADVITNGWHMTSA